MERESFVFYKSWADAAQALSLEARGEFYDAIVAFGLRGEEKPINDDVARICFNLVKPQMDANYRRYLNGCKGGHSKGYGLGNQHARKTNQNEPKNEPKTKQKRTENEPNDNELSKDNLSNNLSLKKEEEKKVDEWDEVFAEWFAYKSEKKQTYKPRGEKAFKTELRNKSNNDVETARAIIHRSMANNWAGIFELKNIEHGSNRNNNEPGTPRSDEECNAITIRAMQRAIASAEHGEHGNLDF